MDTVTRFLVSLIALSALALNAAAQRDPSPRHRDAWSVPIPASSSPREAATRLLSHSSKSLAAGSAIELGEPAERRSLTASHFFFPQTIGGARVLNGGVAISVHSDGTASMHDRTGRAPADAPHVEKRVAIIAASEAARSLGPSELEGVELVAWIDDVGVARIYHRVTLQVGLRGYAIFVSAESGRVAWIDPLFATARARVFDANPVTSTNDATLLDGDDAATSVPDRAYSTVDLAGLSGSGPLSGPHATIVDLEIPATAPADQGSSLELTRDRDEFEEVNAYFQVDRAQTYLRELGFDGEKEIIPYSIEIDPHASAGFDESSYRYTTAGRGRLFFGDGGVDDAEDADIILHELAHAIQDSIVPSGFTGPSAGEARALGEGFADYWAFSASWAASRTSGRDPYCIGDWDARCAPGPSAQCGYEPGTNCLRRVDGTKTMADYLRGGSSGTEHRNGEIWSSALREVFVSTVARLGDDAGRRIADRTILESHFGLPPNPTFRTAALRLIDADRRLNDGALTPAICSAATARGIVAASECDLGMRGDLTLIGSPARGVPIPDFDPNGIRATLHVSDTRIAEAVFVRVDVVHANRGDLRLTLIAPDGTSVVLQVENGELGNDIRAVYGLDAEPAQSLAPLTGKPAAGTWTLQIVDTFGADVGRLVSWGMMFRFAGDEPIVARGESDLSSVVIPVAGSVEGAFGTRFVSDARIANTGSSTANATMFFTPSGADGLATFAAVRIELAPQETIALDDFVRSLFRESGTGWVEIRGDTASLAVTTRIYNETGQGTYGQLVRPGGSPATLDGSDVLHLVHLSNDATHRSNLGITETRGRSGTVELRILDTNGALLASETFGVAPFNHVQMPLLGGPSGAQVGAFRAELRVIAGEALVVAYASVVDNVSGDAIFVPGWMFDRAAEPPNDQYFVIPAVIRGDGANGSRWRSDVRILNRSATGEVGIRFRPANGASPRFESIRLESGQLASIDDVLGTLFGQTEGRGSLEIMHSASADSVQDLVVTSRTWTPGSAGSYGQFIPGVAKSDAIGRSSGPAHLIHIDSNAAFRCNVGLTELYGEPAVARVRLLDASGALRFATEVDVPALGNVQFNLTAAGAPIVSNGRLTIEVIDGSGFVIPYASVVDNATGDPIYVGP